MRILRLDSIPLGAPIGQSLFNERGDVLVQQGTELDSVLIGQLRGRGYNELFVEDKQTEGIKIVDPITPETRIKAVKSTAQTIDVGGQLTTNVLGPDLANRMRALPKTGEVRRTIAENVPADAIFASVNEVVDEVMDAPTQLGLNSIKSQDSFAYGHALEVAAVATKLGQKLGFKKADLRRLARGAMLHDIGQAFTGDTTDGKTGPPSAADVEQVKRHTRIGYDFLQQVPDFDSLSNHVAFQHHEWQNGQGYPRGLRGLDHPDREAVAGAGHILVLAQITSVADIYDALCSDRPFRQRLPRELAMSLIKRMGGAQLNTDIVDLFMQVVPIYPTGYPVRIVGGALDRWQGVVAKLGSPDINRPVVRLFVRPDGSEADPFEVDLSKDNVTRLMTAPPKRRALTTA